MSEARNLARALNLSHSDGLDMMGGAEAEAIEELINEFMAPGSEDPLSDCKSLILQLTMTLISPSSFFFFFFFF